MGSHWSVGGGFSRLGFRSILSAPVRLQTYRNLAYLLLSFPLGITYFVFLSVGLSVGIALVIAVVGVPILLVVLAAAAGLATLERKLAVLLLGIDVTAPRSHPLSPADDRSILDRIEALVVGTDTWKAVVYLASKLVFGIVAFVLVMSMLVTAVTWLVVPFVYDRPHVTVGIRFRDPTVLHPGLSLGWGELFVGFRGSIPLTSWEVTTVPGAMGVALLGVVLIVVALNLLNALAWLSGRYARVMLGDRGFASLGGAP